MHALATSRLLAIGGVDIGFKDNLQRIRQLLAVAAPDFGGFVTTTKSAAAMSMLRTMIIIEILQRRY